ncbi:hypothetical protein BHAOGJBA_4248 [Methylobacterium hispanicum]|uniref:YcaO domain-containing protein n=1 Tax=Methylobacterium hispanicum TaxID=270350 RepID=A0AAV4ZRL5_9HYPH|nr:hypothetical protein [Methylobacterium hispanicum]GJD90706.1 hypothetical protein BHAOGJBA_4248 [Methylobacterium hispanicum]
MTVDVSDLPTIPVGIPVWLDCFERATGTPVRQRFVVDARIAVDAGGELPAVLAATVRWGGRVGDWSFLGAGERTFAPFRTCYSSLGTGGNPAFEDLATEARIASELLERSNWNNESVAARQIFAWTGPHRSTGTEARTDRQSATPARLADSRWSLDEQCEARIEAVRRYAFGNALVAADGLRISRRLPVWLVDPRHQGVEVRLTLLNDWSESFVPWAFSLDRLQEALRFQEILAGVTKRPALPVEGEIRNYDAAWDRQDDLVEFASMLAARRVPELGGNLADMPARAVHLWRHLLGSESALRDEGRPAALRCLADFVALRDVLLAEDCVGNPDIAAWCDATRRPALRISAVELAGPVAAAAPGERP